VQAEPSEEEAASPAEAIAGARARPLDDTLEMGGAEESRAAGLSLESVRPPIKVAGYEQEQFLGRGAFGEVWRAIDSNSGREVAIKFYNHRGGIDWSHMTREVEKLQYLFSDRHVVQLFDVGWDSDPPYYVMEYMGFGSLEDRLREGPMGVPEAVKIIREVAIGLAHAHDKGILHCDLKPGNIMMDQDGKPRLADFGQARLKHEHAPALGTMFYMAPEQADLAAVPDARWDVYALGAMLYRMVTGELPFLTDEISQELSSQKSLETMLKSYSTLAAHHQKPVAHRQHPDIDKPLADLIDKCLEVDPRKRCPNVQSFLHDLDLRESRKRQRPMLLVGLVGPALVVALMAVAAWFVFRTTLATASSHLLQRTVESNELAATSIAGRFGLEVDKRWRILEQCAAHPPLEEWLRKSPEESHAEVQQWLDGQLAYWNSQFSARTAASYWFILDREGKVRALSPEAGSLIGSYFGYREYFHGLGRELGPRDPVPETISAPHRSNIFRSQPENELAVAFSVPIVDRAGEPLGIIAMETRMGNFAEFQGSRNQISVLVDLKNDQIGREGLVVEHPAFDREKAPESFYLAAEELAEFRALLAARLEAEGEEAENGANHGTTKMDYRDPLDPAGAERSWMASIAPVEVLRGDGATLDTDWAIVVQEEMKETLNPLSRLGSMFLYSGLVALLLTTLIIGGMWTIVLLAVNSPGRLRSLKFWGRTTTLRTHASLSLTGRSVRSMGGADSRTP
jgi:serine/threonine protein kinase